MKKMTILLSTVFVALSTAALANVEEKKTTSTFKAIVRNTPHDGIQKVTSDAHIEVLQPYLLPTKEGRNAALYMRVVNSSHQPDRLLSAGCANCGQVQIHSHEDDNGVNRMKNIGSIVVPARGNRNLEPGETHLMLMGINKDIHPGDNVQVTLHFANAGNVNVNVPVKEAN